MPLTRSSLSARLTAGAACIATAAIVFMPSAARGQPEPAPPSKPATPTVASVTAQLDGLAHRAERLAENYNKARIEVAGARRAAAKARQQAAWAAARHRQARAQFIAMVRADYQYGSISLAGALLTSDDPQGYLDQLSMRDLVASQQIGVVKDYAQARRHAAAAVGHATKLVELAQHRQAAVAARRTAVEQQTAKYHRLLDRLNAAQRRAYANRAAASAKQAAAVEASRAHQTTPRPERTAAGSASGTSTPAGSGASSAAQRAVNFALAQIGKPYVFGAAGPDAYDCSGLTMAAWARAGVQLPHLASAQYNYGTHVSADQLRPGDLVFFYPGIGHVAMYIGRGLLVSAPQTGENVKIVRLSYFMSDYIGATRLG